MMIVGLLIFCVTHGFCGANGGRGEALADTIRSRSRNNLSFGGCFFYICSFGGCFFLAGSCNCVALSPTESIVHFLLHVSRITSDPVANEPNHSQNIKQANDGACVVQHINIPSFRKAREHTRRHFFILRSSFHFVTHCVHSKVVHTFAVI